MTATELAHCKYQIDLPGHRFPGCAPLTRDGIAWLVNRGVSPSANRMADAGFTAKVDGVVANLKAGKKVAIGPALLVGVTEAEAV